MSANPNLCTTTTLLAAGFTAGLIAAAAAGSLGGPLELQDEGSFFVNGQAAATQFPDSLRPVAWQGLREWPLNPSYSLRRESAKPQWPLERSIPGSLRK